MHRRGGVGVSTKQLTIINALTVSASGRLTLKQAVELIGKHYYCNNSTHTGRLLGNMVKRGLIKRIQPGVYCLPDVPNASRKWKGLE
jgi:predicted transcriptional regulator of viral defense system